MRRILATGILLVVTVPLAANSRDAGVNNPRGDGQRKRTFPSVPESYRLRLKEFQLGNPIPRLVELRVHRRDNGSVRAREDHYYFHREDLTHRAYHTSIRLRNAKAATGTHFAITHLHENHPAMCLKGPLDFSALDFSMFRANAHYVGDTVLSIDSPSISQKTPSNSATDSPLNVSWTSENVQCAHWRLDLDGRSQGDRHVGSRSGDYADLCIRVENVDGKEDQNRMTPVAIRYPQRQYFVVEWSPNDDTSKDVSFYDPGKVSAVPCEDMNR